MIKGFISYAHEDQAICSQLRRQLSPFELSGQASFWADRRIEAGDDWRDEILGALDAAEVALFLVSGDFFTSDFIWNVELPRACERSLEGQLIVIPVIVRPVVWRFNHDRYCLPKCQAVPRDAVPISHFPNPEDGLHDAARRIMGKVFKNWPSIAR